MAGRMTSFKQRLRGPGTLHGFFLGQPSPAVVEMVGWAGFDFVIVDMEHGPASSGCRAAMPPTSCMRSIAAPPASWCRM
jgi:2-keto-3-deoxy-L-rhamnonate aldolase RhmA